ncbi:hypothetical protein ACQ4PT_039267 [Festuca glaucescens]
MERQRVDDAEPSYIRQELLYLSCSNCRPPAPPKFRFLSSVPAAWRPPPPIRSSACCWLNSPTESGRWLDNDEFPVPLSPARLHGRAISSAALPDVKGYKKRKSNLEKIGIQAVPRGAEKANQAKRCCFSDKLG